MKLEDVLLTEKERKTLEIPYKDDDDIFSAVDRIIQYTSNAQCLKLLDVLKKERIIYIHEDLDHTEWLAIDRGRLSELEKLLKGD